jgi:transmembrane sensor
MQEQNDERKWYLATKVLTSGLDAAEQTEWEVLKNDITFQQEFALVEKYWSKLDTLPYHQIDLEKDWKIVRERVQQQMPIEKEERIAMPWLRYAAIVLVCMAVSFFVGSRMRNGLFSGDRKQLTTIEAPAGSKTYITLPDSSKVWLNAKSKISFDENFGEDNRFLKLEGEAFFDVVKSKVPFRVETPLYTVAVLGTAFNVKAYGDDDHASTTLVRGLVNIEFDEENGESRVLQLKPNEKILASRIVKGKESGGYVYGIEKGIDAENETSWKDGWLSVRGESLLELARKIERLHDVKINFENEELKKYRYTGRLRQLSLEQVLKALALTSPVEFTIDEKSVTLRENQSAKSKYRSLQTP